MSIICQCINYHLQISRTDTIKLLKQKKRESARVIIIIQFEIQSKYRTSTFCPIDSIVIQLFFVSWGWTQRALEECIAHHAKHFLMAVKHPIIAFPAAVMMTTMRFISTFWNIQSKMRPTEKKKYHCWCINFKQSKILICL